MMSKGSPVLHLLFMGSEGALVSLTCHDILGVKLCHTVVLNREFWALNIAHHLQHGFPNGNQTGKLSFLCYPDPVHTGLSGHK